MAAGHAALGVDVQQALSRAAPALQQALALLQAPLPLKDGSDAHDTGVALAVRSTASRWSIPVFEQNGKALKSDFVSPLPFYLRK